MNTIVSREERMSELYKNCQDKIFQSIIGPFGLSKAMFDDKVGGNVTTTHNFKKGIVATASDKDRYDDWQHRDGMKWQDRRKPYDDASMSIRTANKKPDAPELVDGYTGKSLQKNKHAHYEHVTPVKEIEKDIGRNLRMTQKERIELANSPENTTYTVDVINTKSASGKEPSKNDKDLMTYHDALTEEQKKTLCIDADLVKEQYRRSKEHIASKDLKSKIKKEGKELLISGADQAIRNAIRQSLGVLLVELVNSLFNEFKELLKNGIAIGKNLYEEISERLKKIIKTVVEKVPAALSQFLEGGISGFMSNLVTFLLNTFITTAKKIVTAIREGLLSVFKAFKLIFFPPPNLTSHEALIEGIKILSAVVISSIAIILEESLLGFFKSIPFGDEMGTVLMGIITGLLVSFITYQIDTYFDGKKVDEKLFELYIDNAQNRTGFANHLANQTESHVDLIKGYVRSIGLYQNIGASLAEGARWKDAALSSLNESISKSLEITSELALIKSTLSK